MRIYQRYVDDSDARTDRSGEGSPAKVAGKNVQPDLAKGSGSRDERGRSEDVHKPENRIARHGGNRSGRPLASEAHLARENLKPWLVCDPPLSRATWYRREAERRKAKANADE